MIAVWIAVLVAGTILMSIAWAVQRRVTNAGWVDVFWTYGTGLGGAVCALAPLGGAWHRRLLLAAMVGVWSLRLGTYIALRVARSPCEDSRYVRFREDWGADYQRRMARFVIVQGPIAALFAGAVMLAAQSPRAFPSMADLAGLLVFLAGFGIEALSDWQMRRYRTESHRQGRAAGAMCDQGLWSVSRHPNYVGEWVIWWSYPVIAIGNHLPFGWLALAAPAFMFFLLVYVSGIPPLERELLRSRGDAYRKYQARVPAFLPLFPNPKPDLQSPRTP